MKYNIEQIGTKLDKYVNNDYANNVVSRVWDNEYNIGEIKANHEVVELTNGIIVLINKDNWIDYFLIERNWSSDDFPCGFGNMVFYGEGASGNLKEMRHTYLNPYIFYINAILIEESFTELRKYFDI